MIDLRAGDCRHVLASLPDASVDAVVTDPPYELGFLGNKWDASGVAYDVGMWAEVLRVLKPGGHLLSFGGTRTWHRMACAVEDAGFEMRDSIAWLHGDGWPKCGDLGKRIGPEWAGWSTTLKPAHEPIVLARKPPVGTVAANVVAHGTGALNIDACRGPSDRGDAGERWPANVTLDEGSASALDQQSGVLTSGRHAPTDKVSVGSKVFNLGPHPSPQVDANSGGASRFFYCAKARTKERPTLNDGSFHPTVKPLTLMRWLVRLVTPPDGTVLDPFTGSGTTLEAALLEGFHAIGIEQNPDYLPLIRQRLARHDDTLFGATA